MDVDESGVWGPGECQMRPGTHLKVNTRMSSSGGAEITSGSGLSSSEMSPGGTEQSPGVGSCQFLGLGSPEWV